MLTELPPGYAVNYLLQFSQLYVIEVTLLRQFGVNVRQTLVVVCPFVFSPLSPKKLDKLKFVGHLIEMKHLAQVERHRTVIRIGKHDVLHV